MNKPLHIKIPSKTFLIGEYAVLNDAPALIVNTHPCFISQCYPQETQKIPFPTNSPATNFIQDHMDFFEHIRIEFVDPHNGQGGFGASTAQFLTVYRLYHKIQCQDIFNPETVRLLLDSYTQYAWNGHGTPPSGADLLAQLAGKISLVNKKSLTVTHFDWPFPKYDFFILRTGHKVATHEHLQNTQKINTTPLEKIISGACEHFHKKNATLFIESINAYYQALLKEKLVATTTIDLIKELTKNSSILAAKGCGALGADVILIVFEEKQKETLKKWIDKFNLKIIASKDDLISNELCFPSPASGRGAAG